MDKFLAVLQKVTFWLLVASVIGFFLMLLALPAQALTVPKNAQSCFVLANAAQAIAENRDMGMPLEFAQEQIKEAVEQSKGKPSSIIQDNDDVNYVMGVVNKIYTEYKDINPVEVGVKVLTSCMKAEPAKTKVNKMT